MSLQLSVRRSDAVIIIDLQGKATIGRGNDLLSANLRQVIADGETRVLLNLTGLTQVDSSSLSTIVRAFVSLGRKSGGLKLLRPRDNVKLVLETLHLLSVIPWFEDEAQAVASFR
jgi:anti-sigma B factor antagonist